MTTQTNQYTKFKKLHTGTQPLLLGNVWDAHTAKIAEKAGYKAVGTSSHAIANSLGYEDGEEISFGELYFMVERIVKSVKIPVSVDFEAGYSEDPSAVARYVKKLADIGVSGINLEDGIVKKGKRKMEKPEVLVEKIKAIKSKTEIFINARADTYTTEHPEALEESILRTKLYEEAGADGIFIPLIEKTADLKKLVASTELPLNVFTTPKLPKYDKLSELKVKRISHGAKVYELLMNDTEKILKDFITTKRYKIVLGK